MPTIIIEDIEPNSQVTVIVSDFYEFEEDPKPPAEKPEDELGRRVWLVSNQGQG